MNNTEKRRRMLLEQTRNMYDERRTPPAIHPRYGYTYRKLYDESEIQTEGTFGIRGLLCLLLFVAFTFMEQNNTEILNFDSGQIANEIQEDFDANVLLKTLVD